MSGPGKGVVNMEVSIWKTHDSQNLNTSFLNLKCCQLCWIPLVFIKRVLCSLVQPGWKVVVPPARAHQKETDVSFWWDADSERRAKRDLGGSDSAVGIAKNRPSDRSHPLRSPRHGQFSKSRIVRALPKNRTFSPIFAVENSRSILGGAIVLPKNENPRTSSEVFIFKKYGGPTKNRTWNGPLGKGCYIHLTMGPFAD